MSAIQSSSDNMMPANSNSMANNMMPLNESSNDVETSNMLCKIYDNLGDEGLSANGAPNVNSDVRKNDDREHMANQHIPKPPVREEPENNEDEEEYIEEYIYEDPEDDRSNMRIVFDESKKPLLVFAIFFVLSLRMMDRQIALYIPSFVDDYRRLNVLGIVLKACIAGLIFYVVNRFVLHQF